MAMNKCDHTEMNTEILQNVHLYLSLQKYLFS